eukprot:scpid43132/ scgid12642/ 
MAESDRPAGIPPEPVAESNTQDEFLASLYEVYEAACRMEPDTVHIMNLINKFVSDTHQEGTEHKLELLSKLLSVSQYFDTFSTTKDAVCQKQWCNNALKLAPYWTFEKYSVTNGFRQVLGGNHPLSSVLHVCLQLVNSTLASKAGCRAACEQVGALVALHIRHPVYVCAEAATWFLTETARRYPAVASRSLFIGDTLNVFRRFVADGEHVTRLCALNVLTDACLSSPALLSTHVEGILCQRLYAEIRIETLSAPPSWKAVIRLVARLLSASALTFRSLMKNRIVSKLEKYLDPTLRGADDWQGIVLDILAAFGMMCRGVELSDALFFHCQHPGYLDTLLEYLRRGAAFPRVLPILVDVCSRGQWLEVFVSHPQCTETVGAAIWKPIPLKSGGGTQTNHSECLCALKELLLSCSQRRDYKMLMCRVECVLYPEMKPGRSRTLRRASQHLTTAEVIWAIAEKTKDKAMRAVAIDILHLLLGFTFSAKDVLELNGLVESLCKSECEKDSDPLFSARLGFSAAVLRSQDSDQMPAKNKDKLPSLQACVGRWSNLQRRQRSR